MSSLRQMLRCRRLLQKHTLLFGAVVFVTAFACRAVHLDARSIWMDEDAQARNAGGGINSDLVYRAARQQQPPLDYAFETIGLLVFGWNEYGARMHAAILGAGAATLFYFLLMTVVRHPAAVLVGTALFITHPQLVRYSQEGRPISCGVFFSVMWLWAIFRFIRMKRTPDKKASVIGAAVVFFSGFLFLMSVGFQPIVFLFVSTLALTPALFFWKIRCRIFIIWTATAAAGFAALPVLVLGLKKGAAYVAPLSLKDRLAAVLSSAAEFHIVDWAARLNEIMGHLSLFAAVMIPLGLTGILITVRQKTTQEVVAIGYFILFAAAYPWVLNGLFFGLVSRHSLMSRYYLTVVPVLLILLAILFVNAIRFVFGTQKKTTVQRRAGIALLIGLLAAASAQTAWSLRLQYNTEEKTNWRSFYALLKKDPNSFGTAYLMNLVPFSKWAPVRFYATRFYYQPEDKQPIGLKRIDSLIFDLSQGGIAPGSDIYLVVPYGYLSVTAQMFDEIKGAEFYQYSKLSVVHLKPGEEVEKDILLVFDKMALKAAETESNYKIFEMQAALKLLTKDIGGARRAIETLSKIDSEGKLKKEIIPKLERDLLKD